MPWRECIGPQAETALMERITDLDHIDSETMSRRPIGPPISWRRVRALRRATRNLVLRETYNADLRVIRPSGQGTAAAYRVSDLTHELEEFLSPRIWCWRLRSPATRLNRRNVP